MSILEVEHIRKYFGQTEVLKDISFSLEQGILIHTISPSLLNTPQGYQKICFLAR